MSALTYLDYGTESQTKIGATHTIRINDNDNRPTHESTSVDGRTVTLTFSGPMEEVSPAEDPRHTSGDVPHTPQQFFTLFEAGRAGVPKPSDANLEELNRYKVPKGTVARTFSLSGSVVTLSFPHAVDTTHGAWVRYDRLSSYSPLGQARNGRCVDRRGVGSFIADMDASSNTGGTDPLPALTITGGEGTEGTDTDIAFTVTLTPASTELVTVDYRTIAGSATAGEDFEPTTGRLEFTPTQTRKTVRVPIVDDTVEDDGETFLLDLYNASGATMLETESLATGTIRNTEGGPVTPANTLTASFANVPAEHGGAGESNRFTFDLSFSENPKVSYAKLRDHAFTITGGDVKKAQRKVRGSNQSWTITVEPDGWGNVSLAACPEGTARAQRAAGYAPTTTASSPIARAPPSQDRPRCRSPMRTPTRTATTRSTSS